MTKCQLLLFLLQSLIFLQKSQAQTLPNITPLREIEGFQWNAQMRIQFQLGFDAALIGRFGATLGASYTQDWWQAGANLNLNLYDTGLGTPFKASGNRQFQADLVLSPIITLGLEEADPIATYTFNEMSGTQVFNPYQYSFSFAQNLILNNRGRNQRNGSYGLRIDRFSLHFYNDVLGFVGDGRDRWWSGGGQLNFQLNEFQSISLGTEVFTGLIARTAFGRPILEEANSTHCRRGTYVMRTTLDKQLNNGHTYLKSNDLFWSANAQLIGSFKYLSAGYFQHFVHSYLYPTPFFNYRDTKGTFRMGGTLDDQFPTLFIQ